MSRSLRISFFGSSLVSAYWNGAATYYRGIIRSLATLGHEITFYEPDAFERQKHRDIPDPPWARVVVYSHRDIDAPRRMLREAAGSDIVIKCSGVGVFDELLEEGVLELRRGGDTSVIFWDVDAPATLDRLRDNPGDAFAALVGQYDMILTYGGGQPVIDAYTAAGARRCAAVYNAHDPQTHHVVERDEHFQADLAFLGNRLPDREARVEEFFFSTADELPERKFLIGGNGWDGKSMGKNVTWIGHVYTRDHNAFNSTPLALLNISRESMARYGYSPATRVFEAAAAAGCIITDYWPGIEEFFEPGEEILVARDGRETARLLADLTPQRARQIGEAARRRAIAEHTYDHRARELEELLASNIAAR